MRSFALAIAVSAVATSVVAGYAARDAWIAVAGHASGVAGRHFETTVYVTDTSGRENEVTISFFPEGQPNAAPRSMMLRVGPKQSAVIDIGPQLAGEPGAIGALRIRSSHVVVAEARLYSHVENEPRTAEVGQVLNAIPAQYAIGAGDSTFVPVPAGMRYKLYAVETAGFPLYFSVTGGGAERRLLIRAHENRSWDLGQILPNAQITKLTIAGVNGSGRIVVLGTAIAQGMHDFDIYEMALPMRARHRMTWPEMTAYAAVAIAIAATAFYRVKRAA